MFVLPPLPEKESLGSKIGSGLSQGLSMAAQLRAQGRREKERARQLQELEGLTSEVGNDEENLGRLLRGEMDPFSKAKRYAQLGEKDLSKIALEEGKVKSKDFLKKKEKQESKTITQDAFNRMSQILNSGKIGWGSGIISKTPSRKGAETAESVGEFNSLTGALESLLVDMVNKGTLSNTRFKYITDQLLPKANDREATIRGKLKGLARELDLNPEALTQSRPKKKVENESQDERFEDSPEEDVSETRSLLSAFPKGLIRGAESLSKMADPGAIIAEAISGKKNSLLSDLTERFLPTSKEDPLASFLETAGELAPSFALGGGGIGRKALEVAGGALSKEGLKALGAPELAQDIGAGVGAGLTRGVGKALSKTLSPRSSQKEVFNYLKSQGFSDKAITPFLQDPRKAARLGKVAKGFINPEELKSQMKEVSEPLYTSLKQRGKNLPGLSRPKAAFVFKRLDDALEDIHYDFKKLIKDDVKILKSSPKTWKDFRDFEQAINHKIKGIEGGKSVLGTLKGPIQEAERMISPELHKEKQLIDKAYSQSKNLLKSLSGEKQEQLLKQGPVSGIIYGLLSGDIGKILKGFGVGYGVKKIPEVVAAKFLTSPRFQGMQRKLLQSVKSNNEGAALKIASKIAEDLEKVIHPKKKVQEED